MPSKKQRAKAAKAEKSKQEPVAAPPQRHTTLRQAHRASKRAIARAGGDVPVFLYGDNVVPRPVAVKPPPPQLQRTKPKWGIRASAPVYSTDVMSGDEVAYARTVTKQLSRSNAIVSQ